MSVWDVQWQMRQRPRVPRRRRDRRRVHPGNRSARLRRVIRRDRLFRLVTGHGTLPEVPRQLREEVLVLVVQSLAAVAVDDFALRRELGGDVFAIHRVHLDLHLAREFVVVLRLLLLRQALLLEPRHVVHGAVDLRELAQLLLLVRVLVGVQGSQQRVDHPRGSVDFFDGIRADVHVQLVVASVVHAHHLRRPERALLVHLPSPDAYVRARLFLQPLLRAPPRADDQPRKVIPRVLLVRHVQAELVHQGPVSRRGLEQRVHLQRLGHALASLGVPRVEHSLLAGVDPLAR